MALIDARPSGHQPAGYFDSGRLDRRRHEPDRPTAPGLPPRPIDYPRPVSR